MKKKDFFQANQKKTEYLPVYYNSLYTLWLHCLNTGSWIST